NRRLRLRSRCRRRSVIYHPAHGFIVLQVRASIGAGSRPASRILRVALSADRPVAVFDSGVGGLTVLHELLVSLPSEDYLYLGDTARLPYGNRSPEELAAFSIEIADHLLQEGAKLIVVACNSASAAALEPVQRHLDEQGCDVDVIGVLLPAAQLAVAASRSGRIGVLATPATVASGA